MSRRPNPALRYLTVVGLGTIVASAAAGPAPAPGFYSVGSDSVIHYPSQGGNGTHVAHFAQPHRGHYAAAFAPDGTFYTIGGTGSFRYTLARVSPVTGDWARIGDTGFHETWGLAIDAAGNAFATQSTAPFTLYSVNLNTAAATPRATQVQLGGNGVLGLTFTASGRLWGVVGQPFPSTASTLVEIDTFSGDITPIRAVTGTPGYLIGIAFNKQGQLFGSVSDPSFGTVKLVSIDLETGAATLVGEPQPQADARALAFYVPEPTTGWLALAVLIVGMRRR
ncbi:MAG: hypothetical protein AB7Q17_01935 [Phycisphaerae bacterium]